jgi:GGDEF domain-containing protein
VGDDFIYLSAELVSPAQAEEVAERLLGVLVEPFSLAGTRACQHASIGVVVSDGTDKDCTEPIQDADTALYEAVPGQVPPRPLHANHAPAGGHAWPGVG